MADLLIQPGRGEGARYQDLENPSDIWHWLENPPAGATDGIPYAFVASLGDVSRPAPFLYTVELDIAEADLPAIYEWYEKEHLPLLTACPAASAARATSGSTTAGPTCWRPTASSGLR